MSAAYRMQYPSPTKGGLSNMIDLRPDNRSLQITDADAYNLAAYMAMKVQAEWFAVWAWEGTAAQRLVMDTRKPNHWEHPE